jgi:predicted nucleic acid-binding protein
LLGYSAITNAEESLIQDKLMRLTYLPITSMVENVAIRLRRTRCVKLPDAIIVATALEAGVELITFDYQLQSLMADELNGRPVNAG